MVTFFKKSSAANSGGNTDKSSVPYTGTDNDTSNNGNTVKSQVADNDANSDISSLEKQNISEKVELSTIRWSIMIVFLCFSFTAIGINDSATGSNLHNIQERYSISYKQTSFLFLSNAGGYAVSSLCTCYVMFWIGVRWTIFFSAIIYSGGALITSFAPPFGVIVVSLFLQGVGSGFLDAAATSVLALIASADVLSRVYASFSLGSMTAPFIIGAFSQHHLTWNYFYFFPMSLGIVLASTALWVFKHFTLPNQGDKKHEKDKSGTVNGRLKLILSRSEVYLALVLVCLASSHQCINSQWSPSYFLLKGYEEDVSTYVVAGFWGGVTIGRLAGPTVFKKVYDKTRNISLVALAMVFSGVIFAVDSLAARATLLCLTGLAWGPIAPASIDAGISMVLEEEISIITPLIICSGLLGASFAPFFFSFAADAFTANILQPVLIVVAGIELILFIFVPKKQ
ncbi:hypothetical protein E3P92_02875 [Wallemia ichthyophaga]|nr:hypothetical protein E3P92_02875 [Wallemia ichthyophaga]TIB30699.1 hypothetical protein E3P84_03236 [Wallemia ichthyophaga]TIB39996.1 hypothetical protein E3P83_03179 [Wallemia ichthyophaga]